MCRFNVLSSFRGICVIICSMLVMIGHLKYIRHVLICCAYIRGCFESQYYLITVGDMAWVYLVLGRKVWGTAQNVVMCLQVLEEAGKGMANGATFSGIVDKKDACDFGLLSKVNL